MEKDKSYDKSNIFCTNVFKSGKETATTEAYTQKWIEIINILERRKPLVLISKEVST